MSNQKTPTVVSPTLRTLLVHLVLRSKLESSPEKLDVLITETAAQVVSVLQQSNQLLTEAEVAERYKFLNVIRLRNMRFKGTGPTVYRFGTGRNCRVFYKPKDIEAWIIAHECLTPFIDDHYLSELRKTA